jgi:hypothetical protein
MNEGASAEAGLRPAFWEAAARRGYKQLGIVRCLYPCLAAASSRAKRGAADALPSVNLRSLRYFVFEIR